MLHVPHHRARGFTLIEFLTTIAILVIIGGLMVSLARHVRFRSAHLLTVEVLSKLEQAMLRCRTETGYIPPIYSFPAGAERLPDALMRDALNNNRSFVKVLRSREDLSAKVFSNLPATMYDETTLCDAWGCPIVFMRRMNPDIGMAPEDEFFFFSAGPDGKFFTRDDNLYSYDTVAGN